MHWSVWTACGLGPLAVSLAVYGARARVTDATWLENLNQSPLTPKPWVFSVVWTLLYTCMGLALGCYLEAVGNARGGFLQGFGKLSGEGRSFYVLGLAAFVVQLTLNYSYLVVFFRDHDIQKSLKILYALLATTALTAVLFAPASPLAASLLLPYMGYLVVAYRLHHYLAENNIAELEN
jgi:benzodiazapine receptor